MSSNYRWHMKPTIEQIRANLFPASHAAIGDWSTFPWHRDGRGFIQTYKLESSQALAIDVFGTIKASPERDCILAGLARHCGVPDDGPWTLALEWTDPANLLNEQRPTQVDAIAFGQRALLVIECKFTETGGSCTQPIPISSGANSGLRQCTGNYVMQTNPVNGRAGRCALTEKGIRYWETIPQIFGLGSSCDYSPCPFKGDAYQWMRNMVLSNRLAVAHDVSAATMVAYADDDQLPTAKKVRSGNLGCRTVSGESALIPLSYQSIVALACSLSERPKEWEELGKWVERKIAAAARLRSQPVNAAN